MTASRLRSNSTITAIGTYVPEKRLTNQELETIIDTNDEWIVQRTGIRERRIASRAQFATDLAICAVNDMLIRYPMDITNTDYIIIATSTPDTIFPSTAARIQSEFGISSCGAVDLQAACAGFVSGLQTANALILSGMCRKVLVIGAEALSKITDYTDRSTCILFGDGAGAVMVEAAEQGSFIGAYTMTDGSNGHQLYRSSLSASIGNHPVKPTGQLVQNGREVYKWAVTHVSEGVKQLLSTCELPTNELDWFIPHSANLRMIESICERTGIPLDRTLYSLVYYGNTSAASIPLALHDAVKQGKVKPGERLLLQGFGGGLTQAGLLLNWTIAA